MPDLLRVGASTSNFFAGLGKRVAWLVSADLAHTHQASGRVIANIRDSLSLSLSLWSGELLKDPLQQEFYVPCHNVMCLSMCGEVQLGTCVA